MVTSIVNLALPTDDPRRLIEIDGYQAESYSESPSVANFEQFDIQGRSSPIAVYSNSTARTVSFSMIFHKDMIVPYTNTVYSGMMGAIDRPAKYKGQYLIGESMFDSMNRMNQAYDPSDEYTNQYHQFIDDMITNRYEGYHHFGGISALNPEGMSQVWEEHNAEAEIDANARFQIFINKLRALNYPVYSSNGVVSPKVYLKIGNSLKLKGYCNVNFEFDGLVKHNSLISLVANFEFTEILDQSWSATEVMEGMQRYVVWHEGGLR